MNLMLLALIGAGAYLLLRPSLAGTGVVGEPFKNQVPAPKVPG